jgi:hypothetical protein
MSIKLKLKSDVTKCRCEFCGYIFTKKSNLLRHQKIKHDIVNNQSVALSSDDKLSTLSNNDDLKEVILSLKKEIKELKENHVISNQNIERYIEKVEERHTENIQNMEKNIEQLKEKPNVINNILNVVCVTSNDNYLDMLTTNFSDFDKALEYIKSCALANINGDCQLIEKIYFNPEKSKSSFYYLDKARTRIEYFDEKEELTITKKEQFGRKLAHNLQNSYLKGINQVINNNLDQRKCPNKFLEEYDLQTWNQHIYNLSDLSYQRKFMNQLDIPNKT